MIVERDGSNARRLAAYDVGVLDPPNWSPDGTRIAFVLSEKIRGTGVPGLPMMDHTLATIGLEDVAPVHLTDLGNCVCLGVSAPTTTWSPDGTLLAYTRVIPGTPRDPGATRAGGVYVMRPDGTGEQLVAVQVESELAWQPLPEH